MNKFKLFCRSSNMPQSYNNFLNQIVDVDLWTDNIDLARLSNSLTARCCRLTDKWYITLFTQLQKSKLFSHLFTWHSFLGDNLQCFKRDSRSEDRPDTVLMWDWLCLRLEGGPGLLTGCYWHRLVTGLEELGECSCLGLIFHSSKTTVNNIKWMSKATQLCQPAGNTWVREEDLG